MPFATLSAVGRKVRRWRLFASARVSRLAILFPMFIFAALTVRGQIDFDKPKKVKPLPNPLVMQASRDDLRNAAKQMLETRQIPLDKEDCNQLTGECLLVSKSIEFTRGITARSQLEHYCDVPAADVRNWAKGRYSLRIQISPAGTTTAQVGIYAKFEGETDDAVGQSWIVLNSKGELEDGLLRCLDERIRGGECKEEGR
jgi:hypothetical protein